MDLYEALKGCKPCYNYNKIKDRYGRGAAIRFTLASAVGGLAYGWINGDFDDFPTSAKGFLSTSYNFDWKEEAAEFAKRIPEAIAFGIAESVIVEEFYPPREE